MWTWILTIGALLGSALALAALIGWALPGRYLGEIQVRLHASPEVVWSTLLQPRRHPVAGILARRVDVGQDPREGWLEDLGSTELAVVVRVGELQRRLQLDIRDLGAPVRTVWDLRLTPEGSGTLVHARNETRIGRWSLRTPLHRLAMFLEDGAHKVLREYFRRVAEDLGDTAQAAHEGGSLPGFEAA